ncbi:MAG TPA: UDP-3-O-(3-hydroxymyristoyl)glucosamine N-acyltransferase, partial [Allocoleopsis sp.]
MKFSEIVSKLSIESNSLSINPDLNPDITTVAEINDAMSGNISYIEGGKFAAKVNDTHASALIIPDDDHIKNAANERGIAWISSSEPRLTFAQTINIFYQPFKPSSGIHPTAIIPDNTIIGSDVYIGANVLIYEGVKIGNNVYIHPNVVIYSDVEIGDRTVLHANCTIKERSKIGADCMIHSGVVIGAENFNLDLKETPKEQIGYTILEDGVEVGANSTITRPLIGETRIGKSTKIDNLVQIGAGCMIGSNNAIAGQCGLSPGVKMGSGILLAGQVAIAENITIGSGAIV